MIRLLKPLVLLLLWCSTSDAFSAEAYIGQFIYHYKSGDAYRVTVNDGKSMQWRCIEGSEKGAFGTETPERFKINNKVFFVTWREKSGINVSQVVDLKNMKVISTIIDGKERYVVEGKITREK